MAKKISQLESAVDVTANDLIQVIDVEDGDMAPSGTNKKATASLLAKELAKQPLEPGVVISGSSSSDAVRITQTGTGNALVVEDSTNPDSTPTVITSSGSVGIATSSPSAKFDVNGTVKFNSQLLHDTTGTPGLGYAYGPSFGGFWGRYIYTGSNSSGVNGNLWSVESDDASITGSNFLNGSTFQHKFGGSNTQGGRQALFSLLTQDGVTSSSNNNRNYVSGAFSVISSTGDGGTGLTAGTAKGAYFGYNSVATLNSGATNVYDLSGGEINISVKTGASTYYKAGLRIASLGSDAVRGVGTDAMLSLTNQSGAVGWGTAIAITSESGQFPLVSNGTVLGAYNGTIGSGVDFSLCTINTAAFRSPSFIVSGAGVVGIGTSTPNASSQLDVSSTTKGFLPPRMTTTQRDNISTPAAGLIVYNNTTNKLNFYNGSAWEAVTSSV